MYTHSTVQSRFYSLPKSVFHNSAKHYWNTEEVMFFSCKIYLLFTKTNTRLEKEKEKETETIINSVNITFGVTSKLFGKSQEYSTWILKIVFKGVFKGVCAKCVVTQHIIHFYHGLPSRI